MKRHEDGYILNSGKVIWPNRGIIGLAERPDGYEIFEGYDGSWITETDGYDEECIELKNSDLKEIALYMSDLWADWANKL
jgi:hypothetical protein